MTPHRNAKVLQSSENATGQKNLSSICNHLQKCSQAIPNIRSEDAREIEIVREIASAAKLADFPHEEDIPHRNDLPPREVMPYFPQRPSLADLVEMQLKNLSNPKQPSDAPLTGAQPAGAGNQTETHGNSR